MNSGIERGQTYLSDLAARAGAVVRADEHSTWPTLDDAALHGLAGDIVRAIGPHTEADPVAILVQTLLAFGVFIGRGCHIPVEGDQHHANLFTLLCGVTSKGRKGTSWGRVRQIFELLEGWQPTVSGLSSGEGVKWNVRDATEGKTDKSPGDPGVADKRLLAIESEFAQALRAVGRNGNTLSATVREAWDTGNLRTLTKTDPVIATGAHIGIVGHITVDELRQELTETDCANGFANRFLFVCVKRSKVLPFGGGALDNAVLNDITIRLTKSAALARRHSGALTLSEDARAIWARVYPVLSEGHVGLFGAVTGRAEAQCLRLALVYALMDGETIVGKTHLLAALALWEYCEASARLIFGSSIGSPIADEIFRALRSAGDRGLSRTDISGLFKRHQSSERIGNALELLRNRQLAGFTKESTTEGRHVETWKVQGAKKANYAKEGSGHLEHEVLNSLNSLNSQVGSV